MKVKHLALLGSALSAMATSPAFAQEEVVAVQAATPGDVGDTPAPESTDALHPAH